jgi:V8-like Glu-specific endopeptidase
MAKITVSKEVAAQVRKELKKLVGGERGGLFPLHLDVVRNVSKLEFDTGDEETYSALLESICGATDDSQPVEQYNGALGVTAAFVAAHQSPVGQLQWNNNLAALYTNPGNVSDTRWCSGTLISNDLFLTAGHCFDQTGGGWNRPVDNTTGAAISPAEIATNMHVNFNFQVDPTGTLRVEQLFPILNLVEYRLGGLDFAIVRLGGNPGATWGMTQVATTDAAAGDMLCLIGHPAGWPKRIEAGPCLNLSGATITYDDIDTLGGNSGSGVLRASDGRIVGVHTNGGCGPGSPGVGSNSGVRITSIIAQSPTLQALTSPIATLKFFDDITTWKFFDDNITLKFRDDNITLKFRDDNITLKFSDDGGTNPLLDAGGTGTIKAVDDVKAPALDKGFSDNKLPGSDGMPWSGSPVNFGRGGATPFVLSTPHHSMAWSTPTARVESAGVAAEVVAQYEQSLVQLEATILQYLEALNQLDAGYRQILNEYEALTQRRQA